ncbi:peptidyl-tRNA hydrolase [Sulfitobacter brevis]|uniref:Peptidyl-tRNA hydrolase n=1 Tax=Sulfitobacter brevis TaxID=74348 RepID=A0A1I1X0J0_9RHOB|nr:aminoacyl-tRNA hydrolase [Sulfitobacter brevis]SFD98870.1 peptidyl-tRNA hydrolase [Sulfitobacter brevis]
MKLIVGLGNPGGKYARNRHNVGFMALDLIAADHGFSPWKSKHQGSISEGRLGSDRAALLKPETFMNNSGQSVQAAMRFYKLESADVIVFHDEIDLAPGKVKVKTGGGHAGHNGLRSLHAHIGPDYTRVRIGVGHPGHKDAVPGFVLRDFPKADEGWLDDVLRGMSEGAPDLAAGDAGRFMNAVGMRVSPPRSGTGTRGADADKSPTAAPPPAANAPAAPTPEQPQSPLQKLMDRFR